MSTLTYGLSNITHTHTHLREQELINEQLNKKAELLEKGSEQFKTTYEVKGRP